MLNDVGDEAMYPVHGTCATGITYRMWLIGRIASAILPQTTWGHGECDEAITRRIIALADSIIKQLNEEKPK